MISKTTLNGIKFGTISDFPEYAYDEWAPEVWIFNDDMKSAVAIMGVEKDPNIKWILKDIPVYETASNENVKTYTARIGCFGGDEYFETVEVHI